MDEKFEAPRFPIKKKVGASLFSDGHYEHYDKKKDKWVRDEDVR